ncbi:hypothetical protein AAG570_009685 [Ranatra chinensis]|uniref:Coiled-coil domain-containing protein n=1 Tax=Ranatra chinensis TaxID=642074 RepID=A0ABD0YPS4_9HEMI
MEFNDLREHEAGDEIGSLAIKIIFLTLQSNNNVFDERWRQILAQREEKKRKTREAEEKKRRQKEERRELESVRVNQWMEKKKEDDMRAKELRRAEEKRKLDLKERERTKNAALKLSRDAWLRNKMAAQKAEKEKKEQQKLAEEKLKLEKRSISEQKVNEWMVKSKKRHRPVSQDISSQAKRPSGSETRTVSIFHAFGPNRPSPRGRLKQIYLAAPVYVIIYAESLKVSSGRV